MRWNGQFCPSNDTGNHQLPEPFLLNTLTAGIYGASPAHLIFTMMMSTAMKICCASCGLGWKRKDLPRSIPIISVHRLHRQILRLIVLLRHRSLFSPAAENSGKKVLQGSWKAACTHVFIWTIMTMRFLMPDGCGLSARRMDIPLPEIISVR